MKRLFHYILFIVAIVSASGPVRSATVVKARLDSTVLLMGRMTTLQLDVEEPKNAKGYFELFRSLQERGYASVCGDSVELRMPTKIDTVDAGSMRRMRYTVPVQAFDSGAYVLPRFVYVTGKDTAYSNQVALKVVPVNVNVDDPILDYAGTADPEDPSFFDFIPQWMFSYWWIILIVLVVIAAGLYLLKRYRKEGSILPRKPEPTPYEEAISALRNLKEQHLWEQGHEKEYFTDLTEILRRYLYRRFGINAMEMTSRQILHSLSKNAETKDKRAYFRKILDMADFVKFAKVRPLPDDNIASYDNALRFVEETKPVVVENNEEPSEANTGEENKTKKDNKEKRGMKGGKS